MSKPWGPIGAWAAEAEREEAEEKAQAAAAVAAGVGGAGNFPSLREASSTKQKKKKMTLQEFNMQQQQAPPASRGLTPDEMFRLPTGPTQRAPGEESSFGRLGGGFSNYGRRDRDEDRGGGGGGRRSYGGFDDDRRGGGPPSRVSDFDQPSRADEADNWAMGKKSSFPLPSSDSGRSSRYGALGGGGGGGGGMGMSRADEVDNWGAGKKPMVPVRSSTFGSSFRDSRPEPDRWARGVGFGEGEREQPLERRRLVLDPPRGEGLGGGGVVEPVVKTSSNKPNPFGTARPREEVLAEKGLDWKKVDLEIEAKKSSSSRPTSEHSSRPSSAQSSRSEGLGLQGTEGGGGVKQLRPKVNPFGDAKPREVLLQEKGMDWRKIDLDLEHRRVDRPETEAEKNLKEEIDHLKKEFESSSHANSEPLEGSGEDQTTMHDLIVSKERDLELLIRELDDKVRFGQKAIERPGSGAGRVSSFHERPPPQSFQEPRNVEFMDRPRSRGTGDMWSRQGDDRRSYQGGREGGFLSSRDMNGYVMRPIAHSYLCLLFLLQFFQGNMSFLYQNPDS
ncbi:hypothetical protein C3L33_13437, partial [Rhododendron williamsianum]